VIFFPKNTFLALGSEVSIKIHYETARFETIFLKIKANAIKGS
jgi:hypothetical protein